MDLETSRAKLSSGQYTSRQEFFDDMEKIVRNCILYNGEQNDIGRAAKRFRSVFHQCKFPFPHPSLSIRRVLIDSMDQDGSNSGEARSRYCSPTSRTTTYIRTGIFTRPSSSPTSTIRDSRTPQCLPRSSNKNRQPRSYPWPLHLFLNARSR
jgi:hypothetical protein